MNPLGTKEIGTYYYTIDEMCSVNDLKEVIIFVCVCFFVFFLIENGMLYTVN